LYLAGYGAFRFNNDPGWRVSYDDTPKEHVEAFKHVWSADDTTAFKTVFTLYWPCIMAENWYVRRGLR
jgi:hypothetical protein